MAQYQQKVITTPRGENVGYNILNNLKESLLLNRINIKTVLSQRDPINKSIVTTLEFSLI